MKTAGLVKSTTDITTLEKIIPLYDALIIDLWGVVHDGANPYPGIVESLNHLISIKKQILFLSNAPRPGTIMIEKLIDFGIRVSSEQMLTSGDSVRQQLTTFHDSVFRTLGKKFYHLGGDRNKDILAGLQVDVVENLNDANFILLTAYMDEDEDLNQYDDLLKKARALKLPIICANPDKEIIYGDKIRYCAGVLAEKYEQLGGVVHYYGKPYPSVYEAAFKVLDAKGVVDKKRILMVGDTLETDILGANRVGIDSAIVFTGNMGLLLAEARDENQTSQMDALKMLFKDFGATPTWILQSLTY